MIGDSRQLSVEISDFSSISPFGRRDLIVINFSN